jgi:hypothetical protein
MTKGRPSEEIVNEKCPLEKLYTAHEKPAVCKAYAANSAMYLVAVVYVVSGTVMLDAPNWIGQIDRVVGAKC